MKFCRRCHELKTDEEQRENSQRCRKCEREVKKEYDLQNRERVRAGQQKRYRENQHIFLERNRLYKPRKIRLRWLKEFGLTEESYLELLEKQGNKCACCNSSQWGGRTKKPMVDHVHGSNPVVVRGLLCAKCNLGLGLLGDSEEALMRALRYLRRSSCVSNPL